MKNKNSKYQYNRDIFIDNLKKALKSKNMKPQDLANEKIAPQPRISDCLNKNKKANFTLEQVVLISRLLDVSIDELIGNSNDNDCKNTTLHDIIKLLFSLDSLEPLEIESITRNCSSYSTTEFLIKQPEIANFIAAWKEIKSIKDTIEIGETLYNKWKEDALERSRFQYKKWDYKTPIEKATEMANALLRNYTQKHNRKLQAYTAEDIALIRENFLMLEQTQSFDCKKLSEALDYMDTLLTSTSD